MFAILGLNLMKDKLHYCDFNDDNTKYSIYQYHEDDVNSNHTVLF
jgi:hypothetical protein